VSAWLALLADAGITPRQAATLAGLAALFTALFFALAGALGLIIGA